LNFKRINNPAPRLGPAYSFTYSVFSSIQRKQINNRLMKNATKSTVNVGPVTLWMFVLLFSVNYCFTVYARSLTMLKKLLKRKWRSIVDLHLSRSTFALQTF